MSVQRIEQNPRMSEASKAGNLVILAGQVADGETVASQAQSIFANIDALLEKAGTHKANTDPAFRIFHKFGEQSRL